MHPCNRLGCNREKASSYLYREGFLLGKQISGAIGAKLGFVFYNIMFGNALRRKCEAECPRRSTHSEHVKCKRGDENPPISAAIFSLLPVFTRLHLCVHDCLQKSN